MSIPSGKVVLSIMGDTTPYHRASSSDTSPIRLMVQRMDDDQHRWMLTIEPRRIDDHWTESMIRVEATVNFEGKPCECVATYTVEESTNYAGVLIIYTTH